MKTVRRSRPVRSFLLRVVEVRHECEQCNYELLELRTGTLSRFTSLSALRKFVERPASTSATEPKPAVKKRHLRQK